MEPEIKAELATPRLPQGSVDCHVHLYGPFARFPRGEEGRFTPTREWPVESLFSHWDSLGIARGVIVHAVGGGIDHEVTLDALRRYPDRLRAVAVLERDVSDRRLDEMTDAGVRGARINMLRQDGKPVSAYGMGLEDLKAVAPRLAERGWHAQLWIETGDLDEAAAELEALPLDYVVDHMGRTMADKGADYAGFARFCERLKSGRYWCKLSGADRNTRLGPPYADTEPFMRALVAANPDRLVWGTDWPHVGYADGEHPSDAALVELLFRCVPDEQIRHRILVENPTRLYGFEGSTAR